LDECTHLIFNTVPLKISSLEIIIHHPCPSNENSFITHSIEDDPQINEINPPEGRGAWGQGKKDCKMLQEIGTVA